MTSFQVCLLVILFIGVWRVTRRQRRRQLVKISKGQQIDPEMIFQTRVMACDINKSEDEVTKLYCHTLMLTNGGVMVVPFEDLTPMGKLLLGHDPEDIPFDVKIGKILAPEFYSR